jgi:hypothetical protein
MADGVALIEANILKRRALLPEDEMKPLPYSHSEQLAICACVTPPLPPALELKVVRG